MVTERRKTARLVNAFVTGILLACCFTACTPVHPSELQPSVIFTSATETTKISETPPISELNDLLVQWLADRQTPIIMLHNDAISPADLSLLDTTTAEAFSISLPPLTRITNLNNSLSPDQKYLALHEQTPGDPTQNNLAIYDVLQATIIQRINIAIPVSFDASQVLLRLPENEQAALKARNLGAWVLQESLGLSLSTFRWNYDSHSLYFANYCDDGYACLFRYDIGSDHPIQLEDEAGYFNSIRPSPNGAKLLLIKSVTPQLPDFPVSHAIILDKENNIILLPQGETIPTTYSLYDWFGDNEIIRTTFNLEQMRYESLEITNLQSDQAETHASQPFNDYLLLDETLVLLTLNSIDNRTYIKLIEKEKPDVMLTIEDTCSKLNRSPLPGYSALVSCENGLHGIRDNFETNLLLPMRGNFSFSPDFQHLVTYAFNGFEKNRPDINLYDSNFELLCRVPAQNVRHVIWYPDSQGFLYLNPQGLYRVEILNCAPHLLLNNTSDDYRNLDALWYSP